MGDRSRSQNGTIRILSRAARSGRCLPCRISNGDRPMFPFRLYAATGDTLARLDSLDGASVQTTIVLGNEHQSREGHIVNGVMWRALPTDASYLQRQSAARPSCL